jgi:AraC family chitin signaling transcriptional activator
MGYDQQFFEEKFNLTYPGFTKAILSKHSDLTSMELKLCAYLKLNLNSTEICKLTKKKIRTIENRRYRLRKKLNLDKTQNLTTYLISI